MNVDTQQVVVPTSPDRALPRRADVAIIGGGMVGLATAYRLACEQPGLELAVLEKEPALATHQSGRNSGVIHSGIYYKPGSLKARTCREGKAQLEAFCTAQGIAWRRTGKVIVATNPAEAARLDDLLERGRANGVACKLVGPERLREIEPHAAGVRAIHVPEAGVVDFAAVCRRLGELLRDAGHTVALGCELGRAEPLDTAGRIRLHTSHGKLVAERVVNAAGLHADRVARRLTGRKPRTRIVPFRGEFYYVGGNAAALCRGLVYPVPDPRFPFLGVHVTRTVHDLVECGPNAVLALQREGYTKRHVSARELARLLSTPGLVPLLARHWRTGLKELVRSSSTRAFARSVQQLLPGVTVQDLDPAPVGVRAQAVERGGRLVDDFRLETSRRVVNVLNAPSPAATAAFAIASHIRDAFAERR